MIHFIYVLRNDDGYEYWERCKNHVYDSHFQCAGQMGILRKSNPELKFKIVSGHAMLN